MKEEEGGVLNGRYQNDAFDHVWKRGGEGFCCIWDQQSCVSTTISWKKNQSILSRRLFSRQESVKVQDMLDIMFYYYAK